MASTPTEGDTWLRVDDPTKTALIKGVTADQVAYLNAAGNLVLLAYAAFVAAFRPDRSYMVLVVTDVTWWLPIAKDGTLMLRAGAQDQMTALSRARAVQAAALVECAIEIVPHAPTVIMLDGVQAGGIVSG